MLENINYNYEN